MRSGSLALLVLLSLTVAAPVPAQAPAVRFIPALNTSASPSLDLVMGSNELLESGAMAEIGEGAAQRTKRSTRSRRTRAARLEVGYCGDWQPERFRRNPSREEILCRHDVAGPGRFGLLSYLDLPVYQPATPMPGTHLAGVPGHAQPAPGETFEEWEWRVHRTEYPAHVRRAQRSLDLLHPSAANLIIALERRLTQEGIRFVRRETWRHPDRQAYLFQQGRSRPGPIATATLTSWHGLMDEQGRPAGRAVDYTVPWSQMRRFHEIARAVGLSSYGADSHDPGHVYLPLDEPLEAVEIQMLRLLPRVPEVTLATGLPVDRRLPREGRGRLREAVSRWVAGPFVPYVVPEVSGALRAPEMAMEPVAVPQRVASAPRVRRRGLR